jgi:hypothetical protein
MSHVFGISRHENTEKHKIFIIMVCWNVTPCNLVERYRREYSAFFFREKPEDREAAGLSETL